MALGDEQADILGGPILQRPESGLFASFSQYYPVFTSVAFLGLGLLVCIVCVRGLEHLKKHRELRYKKAMRRKHGIPDSDCRPFAVAYAAAKRAHLDREAQDRKKTTNYVLGHNSPVVDQRTDAQRDVRGLRRRVPETSLQLHDYPGKYSTAYGNKRPELHPSDFVDRYNPNPRRQVTVSQPSSVEKPPAHRPSRKNLVINIDNSEESRKRSFEDENDIKHETIKKSRIDGHELIDGDEQADWYNQQGDLPPPRRLSQEFLGQPPAVNFGYMDGRERSKRVVDDGHEPLDETMRDIAEDEVIELEAVIRGKKRGRAEAESTFGGDDDDDVRNGRVPHHRKRRTVSRRRMEVPARGQKRDREAESPEGEGDGSETSRAQRSSKKKRGKKAMPDKVSKMPVEDPCVSKDPLCSGRRVGDEWEADSVRYKVGNNGERLRLALVKKARNKYHMPQDSQHPDRLAALEIYVETWMTDEQYKQAEGREELAWQEGPRESRTPDVPDSPTKNGKNLLWDSIKGSPARHPFRQLMPPGALTRINPFEQRQLQPAPGRRVASSSTIVSPMLPGVADTPTRLGCRGFSKWEKQDREAEALARIRAKTEEQKKDQASSGKPAEILASVAAPGLGAKSLSVPTITLTPAPIVAAGGDSSNGVPQSKSDTSTSFAIPLSISDSKSASTTAPATTTSVSLATTSMHAAAPSIFFPTVPTASATASTAPLSPFPSPSIPPAPTSATHLSSVGPNPFEKGAGAGMASASTPSSSIPGPTTQSQSPSTESTFMPTLSFTKPDTAPSSATVTIPPTTKFQAPRFGDPSSSSPSRVTFGSAPATAKAEVLSRPPIPAPTTMFESSKPTAPLFSFSGTASSSSTATHPTSSTSSAPKFSFGQPPITSTFMPSSDLQPEPAFKFGQTPSGTMDGDSVSTVPAADAPKKSAVLVSIFDTTAGSNEPVRSLPFGTAAPFGSSTLNAVSANFPRRSVTADDGSSTSAPPRSTSGSANTTTPNNALSPMPVGAPAPGNTPVFSFSGINSSSKYAEGTKPTSLFGGGAGGSHFVPNFSGSSTENKPVFAFNAPAEGSKPTFGGITEGSKPPVLRSSAESSKPMFTFSGAVEESKPTFAFGGVTGNKSTSDPAMENAKSFTAIDSPKPTSAPGTTTVGPSSSPLTFAFGKDDAATNTSTDTQAKPTATFIFGAPSGAANSVFGKTSASLANGAGDSSQSIFGKPSPSAFGFTGTGGSSSSSSFTFGKPVAQNQKQEQ